MRGRRLAGVSWLAKGPVKGLVIRLMIGLTAWASAHPAAHAAGPSAFGMMSPELQAMQRDDSLNPGMLWVLDGQARWARSEGPAGKSCADCHHVGSSGACSRRACGGIRRRSASYGTLI